METGTQSIKIKTNIAHIGDIEIEVHDYDNAGTKALEILKELTLPSAPPKLLSEAPDTP